MPRSVRPLNGSFKQYPLNGASNQKQENVRVNIFPVLIHVTSCQKPLSRDTWPVLWRGGGLDFVWGSWYYGRGSCFVCIAKGGLVCVEERVLFWVWWVRWKGKLVFSDLMLQSQTLSPDVPWYFWFLIYGNGVTEVRLPPVSPHYAFNACHFEVSVMTQEVYPV